MLCVERIVDHFIVAEPLRAINTRYLQMVLTTFVQINILGLCVSTNVILAFSLHYDQRFVVSQALFLKIRFKIANVFINFSTWSAVFRNVTVGIQIICFSDSRREFW